MILQRTRVRSDVQSAESSHQSWRNCLTGLTPPAWTATIGAHNPAIRLKNEAIPVPVPRFGAGKISGVLVDSQHNTDHTGILVEHRGTY